jgi:HEAT repeat protein
MPLFGPPDVARLEARRDVLGLIKALGFQKDPQLRCAAAEALGRCGDARAIEPLLAALEDPDPDVRSGSAKSLGLLHVVDAVEPLLKALADADHGVRASAARSLGSLGDARAVEPLVAGLKDGYAAVREASSEALGHLASPAVEPLIAALKDSDGAARKGASEALVQMGAPAVDSLVAALRDPALRTVASSTLGQIGDMRAVGPLIATLREDDNDQVRRAAAETLDLLAWSPDGGEGGAAYWAAKGQWQKCVEIGRPAVEPLIGALKHHDSLVRQVAARGLGQIGDLRAVEPLIDALRGREDVRAVAAEALGRIDDVRAVEPLLAALKDGVAGVRAAAARALGRLGDVRAVERLIAALKDHESIVRGAAAEALGEIGDVRAVEPLMGCLKGREDVRVAAAVALGVIGDARAVEPLIATLRDWRVTVPAAEALARIGAPAAAPLVATLNDRSDAVRDVAVEALIVQIGAPSVAPLIAALGSERDTVRERAADALDRLAWTPDAGETGSTYWAVRGRWEKCVQIGGPAVETLIVAARSWQRPEMRSAAAGALGIVGDPRAVEPLCTALKDGDATVREAAAQALGSIGDARAVEPLIGAVKDRAANVRKAAANALGRIDDDRARLALEAVPGYSKAQPAAAPAEQTEGPATEAPAMEAPATEEPAMEAPATEAPVPAAAQDVATTAPVWAATHLVPPAGMAAWEAPDPARRPAWQLAPRLDLVIDEVAGDWARVRAVNGWWGWVDGRLLVKLG